MQILDAVSQVFQRSLKSTSGHQILDCSHSFESILLLLMFQYHLVIVSVMSKNWSSLFH